MAITHYIDSTATEIARARIKSTTNRVPEAFPVLVYGDTRPHNFVFWNGQTGSVESYSGNASYSLRVTLGQVQEGPKDGTYNVTCGSTESVPALADAETLQDALNLLTTIISEGGVVVTGTFPNFLVTWNTVGVKTAFTVDSTLLIPQTGISLVTMQTGSASVVNQVAVVLRQAAISSQTSWTTISSPANGWTGTITTNTSGALQLLNTQGQQVGNVLEVSTLLTAEVLDASNIPVSYYQTPVILRAKNLDPNGTVSPGTPTYTLGDILYGNSLGGLSKLPGSTSVTLKVLSMTGDGTNAAAPAWVDPDTQGVASITGTANQIAASASTGDVTLSLAGPHNFTSLTSTALLLGAGTSSITASNLTYSTPTLSVPDAFNVSSAGSIKITTASTNSALINAGGATPLTAPRFQGLQIAATQDVRTSLYMDAVGTNGPTYIGRRAKGTLASPTGVVANDTLAQYAAEGYGATGYVNSRPGIIIAADDTWTDTVAGAKMLFGVTLKGGTTGYNALILNSNGSISSSGSSRSIPAWGSTGPILEIPSATITDTTSSGTVATTAAVRLATPTFAASNSTTFTNAANLYIAGDVTAGTNVTLTNSYGLWNVGKTRLDGLAYFFNQANFQRGANLAVRLGADSGATTVTDSTNKVGRIGVPQYLTANTDFLLVNAQSTTSANLVQIGGGSSAYTAATSVDFYTAADQTTVTGTRRGGFNSSGAFDYTGPMTVSTDTLSGAGAVSVTKDTTKLTSTGVAQAITLANGVDGQIKRIIHDVDGGSMILTPTTKTGWSTATFTNAGDSLTLEYATTRGWFVLSSYGTVVV